ncbi:uncharacterized protein LOC110629062 [Manihot esculenta]|uniref:DUF868 domain-containing protein n=1 Tax=Manihot esculenta TaxID=3983 RepID=A0A2C9UQD7_MANES|nr:uncharacterized protein LOC110629062 [Manihot esculenta]
MSFQHPLKAFSLGAKSAANLAEKIADNPVTNKTPQCMVTSIYQMHVSAHCCNVTVLWCKNLMNHSLNLIFNNPEEGEIYYSCKIDLKPWFFWSKRGSKSFDLQGCQVDIHWDFRSARFFGSPEPCSDYYVALVSDGEVVLMLGDYKKKAYKRTKARPALVDPTLFYKKENVLAKKSFSTRAKFKQEMKQEHDIVVESSTTGPKDPEMWISIDGIVVIHVKNLQWKFRGNQTVMVNEQQVQILWDVHDWLFNAPGAGHGLFIFKPGAPEPDDDKDDSPKATSSDSSDLSKYFSTTSSAPTHEFCLFLYAWKME